MRTSVNLLCCDMHKIAEAVEKCHLSHSKILCICLRKFFAVHPERLLNSFADQLVEYQPKGMGYKIIRFILMLKRIIFSLILAFLLDFSLEVDNWRYRNVSGRSY